ncbi:MAG TPA: polyamine ABC transporter substrate-binding protein [Cyanobacteria bacterium UBA8553]|nr:polyamine ABC transporter substrate-binding protein [Cyanobacteria bacterium UBA8553]
MKRRSFLVGASALTLGQLVSGCNSQQDSLKVRILKDSLPPQLRDEFHKILKKPATLKFDIEAQLQDLFKSLQTWKQEGAESKTEGQRTLPFIENFPLIGKKKPALANLVTLGDYWLEKAIRQQLIQPLNIENLKGWQQLPRPWQEIVKRNRQGQLDKSGQVWGAPYRWGTTVIAYNRDKLKEQKLEPPKDWSDLWNLKFRGRISLLDQPREVIGLTLKKLGLSYNTVDLSQVKDLEKELLNLHQQVKFYSSNNYLQPLILGDTYVAVGWSTDILATASSYRQIEAIVPRSGTALWADLWVQPASSGTSGANSVETGEGQSLVQQWIDFCWKSKPAQEISLFSNATSPIILSTNSADLPKDLRENRLRLPDASVLNKSEFLKPLPDSSIEQYKQLWEKIRLSKISR